MLKLTIATRGMLTLLRALVIVAKMSASLSFFASASEKASWMIGPSAMGSEKGMPTSMMLAPAASIARRTAAVVSCLPPGTGRS